MPGSQELLLAAVEPGPWASMASSHNPGMAQHGARARAHVALYFLLPYHSFTSNFRAFADANVVVTETIDEWFEVIFKKHEAACHSGLTPKLLFVKTTLTSWFSPYFLSAQKPQSTAAISLCLPVYLCNISCPRHGTTPYLPLWLREVQVLDRTGGSLLKRVYFPWF